ncbi:intraflagellar transport-associated protein-like isoform X2 [Cynocephalus volans]
MGAFGTNSSGNILTSAKFTHKNESNDRCLRNKTIFLHTSSQCSEKEQIVVNEGQKVGSSFQGDLNRAGKVKVNNFLDLEDLDMDEEIKPQMSKDLLLLPGEVEQDVSTSVPSYFPSMGQPLAPEMKPKPAVKGMNKPMEEVLHWEFNQSRHCLDLIPRDEVQPFSLDEEFDYDNVALTPKFTAAEIETIKELCKQERKNTNTDVEEPCD